MEAQISVPAFISEPEENVMPGNVTNTEEKSHNHTCNACIDRKNILIQNQKTTEIDEPGTPIEKKENRERCRFSLEIGMEVLVKRVVKKNQVKSSVGKKLRQFRRGLPTKSGLESKIILMKFWSPTISIT